MSMRRTAAALPLLLLLVSLPAEAVLAKGDLLKPFSLKALDDRQVTVTVRDGRLTVIEGDVVFHPEAVLMDFWATWCVPCRKAMPVMQKLHDTYRPGPGRTEGGLKLFGISLDIKGSRLVKPFFERMKFTYDMLADPPDVALSSGVLRTAKDIAAAYDVQEIPVVYIIDASGTIVHVHVGFKDEHAAELEAAVSALISSGAGKAGQ